MMALTDEHLAELHRRARELGVPSYRMLTRDGLIEAIEREGGDDAAPEVEGRIQIRVSPIRSVCSP